MVLMGLASVLVLANETAGSSDVASPAAVIVTASRREMFDGGNWTDGAYVFLVKCVAPL